MSQLTRLHLTFLLFLDRLLIREKKFPGWGWEGVLLDISGNERPHRIAEEVENSVLAYKKKIGKGFELTCVLVGIVSYHRFR